MLEPLPQLAAAPWTPLASLAGGALIGGASSLLFVLCGRITGLSGIYSGALIADGADFKWKLVYVGSHLTTFSLLSVLQPALFSPYPLPLPIMTVAGVLVGFGTRLGSGCTSGHGVSGLARLSRRSIVAVSTFMASAMLTATLAHGAGLLEAAGAAGGAQADAPSAGLSAAAAVGGGLLAAAAAASDAGDLPALLGTFASAAVFATGVALSGMTRQPTVLAFLVLDPSTWNSSLAFVMAAAIPAAAVGFRAARGLTQPLAHHPAVRRFFSFLLPPKGDDAGRSGGAAGSFSLPTKTVVDAPLVLGAACFGVGWGLGGLCPGPGVALAAAGHAGAAHGFVPGLVGGFLLHRMYSRM